MQGDTAGPNPLARPDPMRWIRRGLAALLLLTLIAAAVLAAYAWRTLPPHEGTLALAGARGEIRIERDAHGIPTIVTADRLDAYYGLGVVHAQDRLWQLETHRRIGSGSTAEAFGPAALETDRFLRALGVRRAAEAQWARAPAATREALQAYAAGINAVVAAGGQARLELEDEGPGILRERREGLFDALVTRKPDGDGVGLFSVKAAAQVLGGRVSVGEAPCGGALSRVSSPLRASKGLEEVHVHGR